jgi:hypothetical protein
MIKSYKLTKEEKDFLIGKKTSQDSYYNPIKDKNGNYFIFETEYKECNLGILTTFEAPEIDENDFLL